MNIDNVKFFLDTTQTLNFSETAQRLHVSQPTVSKYIGDLESQLNLTLYDRSGGRLRLTPEGKALVTWAQQLVDEHERFYKMANVLHGEVAGPLKIACSTAAGKYVLPMLAVQFQKRFPLVDVSMYACRPYDVDDVLRDEESDLAVVSYETTNAELECQVFFYDQIILIAPPSHPWSLKGEIHPDDLFQSELIIREPTSGTRRSVQSALAAHDISLKELQIVLELGNAEAIVNAVALGVGAAFISRASADFALRAGCVKEVNVSSFYLRRKICMLRRITEFTSRVADVFWNFIHEPENNDIINSIIKPTKATKRLKLVV